MPEIGGLRGIRSRCHAGFFEKVTPAFVTIRGALRNLELSYLGLCVLLTPDDCDYSRRPVSPDVVQNDGVGSAEFVACQKESIRRLFMSLRAYDQESCAESQEKAISVDIAFSHASPAQSA